MSINNDTAVIIPAYNESAVIVSVLKDLQKAFSKIIVIDDGSNDETLQVVKKAGFEVISHPINLGQGAAIQTGIEYAINETNAKYIATFDSDGQHRPEDLKKMRDKIDRAKYDIVLGSRFLNQKSQNEIPALKKILLRAATWLTKKQTGLKLTDSHNGLRIFTTKSAQKIKITSTGMAHASEFLTIIANHNFKYCEVPVTIKYTEYSKSKGQSMFNAVNIFFDMMLGRFK